MLKKLDRYIIGKYLSTFFFTVLIFTLIAAIIDFSTKVEDFIEEDVTVWQILFDYEINFMLMIDGLLLPLYALISVIFFTSRMANNSEIISILNSGVSFQRLLMPYMIAAAGITAIHLIGNHYVIPKGNKTRLDFEHTYVWHHNNKGQTSNIHLFLDQETKVFIKYYRRRDTTARDFQLEKIKDNELKTLLKAEEASWQGELGKWRLKNYEIHSFDGLNEDLIIGKGEHIDTLLNLTPEDFVRYINQKEMMVTSELNSFVQRERERGVGNTKVYEVEIQRRTAEPFSILILTIIGVAVAARKVRGGMGLHLALGVGLAGIFIFLSKFSITFATNESLSAALGVWIPNFIFSGVALFLAIKAQK